MSEPTGINEYDSNTHNLL